MELHIVIVAGGTGGHLFPGIAVAQEFLSRPGIRVTFLTTPKPVTGQILERYQLKWEPIASRALKGEGLFSRLRTVFSLPGYVLEARARLKTLKPHLVLGMGGYAAGPVGLAACSLGIPLAIHEQNAIPGTTNRWLSRFASRVFLSFPDTAGNFPEAKTLWTGNPIRGEFFEAAANRPDNPFSVMLMGGSQGARHLNFETLASLPRLAEVKENLRFLHLTGEADYEAVASGYREAGFAAQVAAFTPEVARWLAQAHLLVCRAGASSLAELAAVGRAALLVPYPFAANNHQEHNARFFEASGAAEVILNKNFTGELLAGKIRQLMADPEALARMEAAARSLAKPHAAREIVEGCLKLLH
ncbi:MAG: undecaprenyldiphospho-muramoylpentapeptide beta-N-acetylglucosaminyltransferase [Deltaproteobacteria bacterium]|nr:undecaprenyldiphospho-muramoylpentapeptide beta-N-acetylglucosaminyltransferase [Deltaproteobacteria bacterium]